MKRNNTYRGYLEFESEFDHQLACWAVNHNGWAKFKAWNRKVAKKREKRAAMKDIEQDIKTYDQSTEENI